MTYTFPHYHHVTQLWYRYGSVNGGNDCAEGTMARYLRETGFPWVGDDVSLVSHLRLYMRRTTRTRGTPMHRSGTHSTAEASPSRCRSRRP
jgi:hypothetical protein